MIVTRCAARRRGHGLLKAAARDDVLRLLARSSAVSVQSGVPRRPDVAPVNPGDERANDVVRNVFEIGSAADVSSRDLTQLLDDLIAAADGYDLPERRGDRRM